MAAAPAGSRNKHDKKQYSYIQALITFWSPAFFGFLHWRVASVFLLSSSLIKILEVPLNIDWLQESIWFYYLTFPCWLWCEHSSGRCSSSSETLELKGGFLIKCLFSSWDLLPRKERLEFPGIWAEQERCVTAGSGLVLCWHRAPWSIIEHGGNCLGPRDGSGTAAGWEGPEGKTALHTFSILATVIPN